MLTNYFLRLFAKNNCDIPSKYVDSPKEVQKALDARNQINSTFDTPGSSGDTSHWHPDRTSKRKSDGRIKTVFHLQHEIEDSDSFESENSDNSD